jgi:hypothetical protein
LREEKNALVTDCGSKETKIKELMKANLDMDLSIVQLEQEVAVKRDFQK